MIIQHGLKRMVEDQENVYYYLTVSTTLNGEGLQHEDGHSHILASTIPNCVSYDRRSAMNWP